MKVLLDLPFYPNGPEQPQCMQAAMQVVIRHFLSQELSLEELDRRTRRPPGCWTWTPQVVPVLWDLGLDVSYSTGVPLERFLEGESFLRRHLGEETARVVLERSDWPRVEESMREVLRRGLVTLEVPSFWRIERALEAGGVPLMLFDHNVLEGRDGPYQGHFAAVTGFDEASVYYHESGPAQAGPHRRVDKSAFLRAWNARGTDNDLVLVRGARVPWRACGVILE